MQEVDGFMNQTKRDRWSYYQMNELLRWIEENERLPDPSELPRYVDTLPKPQKPLLYMPE